jgi:hypothetical protein
MTFFLLVDLNSKNHRNLKIEILLPARDNCQVVTGCVLTAPKSYFAFSKTK